MKLTDGRVIVEVADERGHELAIKLGYRIVVDTQPEPVPEPDKNDEPVIPEPRKPRGRPRKAA